jgi:hypothetical protein
MPRHPIVDGAWRSGQFSCACGGVYRLELRVSEGLRQCETQLRVVGCLKRRMERRGERIAADDDEPIRQPERQSERREAGGALCCASCRHTCSGSVRRIGWAMAAIGVAYVDDGRTRPRKDQMARSGGGVHRDDDGCASEDGEIVRRSAL